ncbi:hypothetical protein A3C26_01685 [Candidatus Daviesbacteria bacterium RIFCSPHIGHO2_02_FULL_39_12]|uniref:DUF1003 domain-containing protein n=2 Tax=Candidatus Daviesiibacteriota TaxID=1752718 RepID=A0A1F5JAJ5_9BACT|nr:MAG: hypothetical protein A3C26_01685 [Candidatus Daviesbacteria bacterium RIFCSPHIGHO2_02_FULL_39_12]OGE72685.1 MAG: hypothetical protein A3H40_00010 [Candidatus Daviesbacteria bacterium RIFCSPLOWO2_02_FULL_38_15]
MWLILSKLFFGLRSFFMINTTKLVKWVGNPPSLIVHTIILGSLLLLRYFEIISAGVLATLTTAIALEAIFLVIFLQIEANKNSKSIAQMQKKIAEIQSEETETHKLMVNILHIAHQIKSIQQDLDTLRRGKALKNLGNGHRIHA